MIRLFVLLFVMLCLCLGYAYAGEPWTREDKAWAAALSAALIIDWSQTRNIAASGHFELNPILGRNPSSARINAYFLLVPVVGYFVLDSVPHRTTWLKALTVLEVGTISRNYYIGVRTSF